MSAPAAAFAATDFHLREEEHLPPGGFTHLGFWIYLMSDCLIFAVLFATYGVLGTSLAGGPGPRDLFELPLVALNTTLLLISSITYGFVMLAMNRGDKARVVLWLAVTGAFGASTADISSACGRADSAYPAAPPRRIGSAARQRFDLNHATGAPTAPSGSSSYSTCRRTPNATSAARRSTAPPT